MNYPEISQICPPAPHSSSFTPSLLPPAPHLPSSPTPPPRPSKGRTHKQQQQSKLKSELKYECRHTVNKTFLICNVKKHVAAVQNVNENPPLHPILFLSSDSSIPTKSLYYSQQQERTYTASLLFPELNVKTKGLQIISHITSLSMKY